MEVQQLYGFTLLILLVGMVLGVGVLVLDKFSTSVLDDTSGATTARFIYTNNYTTLTHNTVTASSYASYNGSGTAMTLEFDSADKWQATKVKLVSPTTSNGTAINVTYTYGADSEATDALQASRGELSTIATTWLGLVITIAILSIILLLVIRSFAGQKRE